MTQVVHLQSQDVVQDMHELETYTITPFMVFTVTDIIGKRPTLDA